jgi:hypothetical protein
MSHAGVCPRIPFGIGQMVLLTDATCGLCVVRASPAMRLQGVLGSTRCRMVAFAEPSVHMMRLTFPKSLRTVGASMEK